jgi:hypothetical protein
MNYLKVYCNLIKRAEDRDCPKGYTERHHVFPKSIFGNNDRIVVLTGREHYIAHLLLQKMCEKRYGVESKRTQKMLCAHINMKSKGRYFNSYLYEIAKEKRSKSMTGSLHWNWKGGKKYKKKEKRSKSMTGSLHWNWKGGKKYKKKEKYNTNEKYKRYTYQLIDPKGDKIETTSLRKTCEQNNLDHRNMSLVSKGKRNHHKGWKCKVLNIL